MLNKHRKVLGVISKWIYRLPLYKDDALNDPKVDEKHLELLLKKNPIYDQALVSGKKVFLALEQAFAVQDYQLIDLKIEVFSIVIG